MYQVCQDTLRKSRRGKGGGGTADGMMVGAVRPAVPDMLNNGEGRHKRGNVPVIVVSVIDTVPCLNLSS